jgi:hypothetical protein
LISRPPELAWPASGTYRLGDGTGVLRISGQPYGVIAYSLGMMV